MPLWKIYHPENAFSDEDKQAIAQRITAVYGDLPRFYVGVVFEAVARTSFFIGGEPADDFVRISVDHIARQIRDEETKTRFLEGSCRPSSPTGACAGRCMWTRRPSASGASRACARPCPERPRARNGAPTTSLRRSERRGALQRSDSPADWMALA
jgi:phenylpyruvate tautomerase PptA (4-oxalocrotonate tautomerase family)